MTFDEYQKMALKTDVLGNGSKTKVTDPAYIAKVLGLVGEAGEVAEKYKKIIRDKDAVVSPQDKDELIKELGDVLWYVAVLSHYLGIEISEVAERNIRKLSDRKNRNALRGQGDNR